MRQAETPEQIEERRNKNLHTYDELIAAGNKLYGDSCSPNSTVLSMRRGNTVTVYSKRNDYWTPISARTI